MERDDEAPRPSSPEIPDNSRGLTSEELRKLEPANPEFFDAVAKVDPGPWPFPEFRVSSLEVAARKVKDVYWGPGGEYRVLEAMVAMGQVLDGPQPFDFLAHLKRQIEFSGRVFGPDNRYLGIIDHIKKELKEVEAAQGMDTEEWIDIMILAIDGAWRAGATAEDIIRVLVGKQTKNEARKWPDWRTTSPNKAIEHDRSDEGGQKDD